MKYVDDRSGIHVAMPKPDVASVFVWSFSSIPDVDLANDTHEQVGLEEMASPQFRGVMRSLSLDGIMKEVLDDEKNFWEDDMDFSTATWEFLGWKEPVHGHTNLMGVLYVEDEVHGMLVIQHVKMD